jgi:hypothetical protein
MPAMGFGAAEFALLEKTRIISDLRTDHFCFEDE